ncbi:MAG: Crp/Fnr family transcriptional regulator [Gammaproteobacteria bacterium]
MARSDNGSKKNPPDRDESRARAKDLRDTSTSDVLGVIANYKTGDREVRAGQDIVRLGEPCEIVYTLIAGWAFLYSLLQDGRRQILQFALPGAVLGLDLLDGGHATYGVEALTDTMVSMLPHKALEPLSQDHPEIGLKLAELASRDRNLSYDHISSIGWRSAHERVAHLLLELFIRSHAQWPGHRIKEMHLPLTQEHIGDATGLTGVHVNRVLRDFRRDGVVEFRYRRLTILDPDKLVDVAEIDPQLAMSWISRRQSD